MNTADPLAALSLIVITLDEEDRLAACLESVPGAGEIIVVDSFSRDATAEIASRFGAQVYRRRFVSHAEQKNWALGRATRDWVLILDADERLGPGLRAEIAAAIRRPGVEGYWIYRRNEFFGKQIRFCGWGRDRVLRLFRRGRGRYPERAVHERLVLDGAARTLRGRIEHRPYRDLDDYVERMRRYSRRGAIELHSRGRSWFPGLITRPATRFIRMYLLQLGFLDGAAGILLCLLAASGVMLKYAYLREMRRGDPLKGAERR